MAELLTIIAIATTPIGGFLLWAYADELLADEEVSA